MPPKPRFNKEKILETAKDISAKEGISSINARRLAKALGASTQPLFSYYPNMDVLKRDLLNYEGEIFIKDYLSALEKKGLESSLLWLCSFADKNPNEFHDLFSSEGYGPTLRKELDGSLPIIALALAKQYKLPYEKANIFYLQNWVFAYGVASLLSDDQFFGNEKILQGLLENQIRNVLLSLKEYKKR